ncbi:MAG: hypothetical protein U0894_10845 [Pirellulales bacterium]
MENVSRLLKGRVEEGKEDLYRKRGGNCERHEKHEEDTGGIGTRKARRTTEKHGRKEGGKVKRKGRGEGLPQRAQRTPRRGRSEEENAEKEREEMGEKKEERERGEE